VAARRTPAKPARPRVGGDAPQKKTCPAPDSIGMNSAGLYEGTLGAEAAWFS
jgi:hypothetical protein